MKSTAAAQTRNSYLVRRAALKAEEAALAVRIMLNERTASASSCLPPAIGGALRGSECNDTGEEGRSCVHCLKGLPLKMDEKYTEIRHLWSGKFAQKTQRAIFCLNKSNWSNSLLRKRGGHEGEKMLDDRINSHVEITWSVVVKKKKKALCCWSIWIVAFAWGKGNLSAEIFYFFDMTAI